MNAFAIKRRGALRGATRRRQTSDWPTGGREHTEG